MKQIMVLIHL